LFLGNRDRSLYQDWQTAFISRIGGESHIMRGNISLSDLPQEQEVWLIVCVSGVSYSVTKTGKRYAEAAACNATGQIKLRCWNETLERYGQLRAGLYGVTGALNSYREQQQFVLSSFRPIDAATYREHQQGDPPLPRAFTFDLESIPQKSYKERASAQLRRSYESGTMPSDRPCTNIQVE
jgi:DNA polymerase III alpha subunit